MFSVKIGLFSFQRSYSKVMCRGNKNDEKSMIKYSNETFLIAELSDSIHALLYRRMINLKIEMKMFYELNDNLQQT